MKTILVALDGSPRAGGILASAVGLAKLNGAKLVLMRSFGLPPAMPPHVWALPDGSLIDTLRHDAKNYLDACARDVPPELLGEVRVELGAPWQAVCQAARAVDADLVVIGAHGFGGVDHLLGTTAAKIVNHIDRPLLVVRPKPEPAR
jgi:nucleotide-binding universal stress UspA family protein